MPKFLRPPRFPPIEPIPDAARSFPRADWEGVMFAWPDFGPGEDYLKLAWAGRACSLAFEKAMSTGEMGSLGVPELALALFDKVDELNWILRADREHDECAWPSPESWLEQVEDLIGYASKLTLTIVKSVWPDSPLVEAFADETTLRPFVRYAMTRVWQYGLDSFGNRPSAPYDPTWAEWIDTHIPDPDKLPPRPFTRSNTKDPHAEPVVIWVDRKGNIVPTPDKNELRIPLDTWRDLKSSQQAQEIGSAAVEAAEKAEGPAGKK